MKTTVAPLHVTSGYSTWLTPEGIDMLDRVYNRLSGCNASAGRNFVDAFDLRAAFGVIEHIFYIYSRRTNG